jgi:NAD+ synthase (glutamine-hydrolysing)
VLLNTGNKSEAAMGFSTLYGDTAGAFAPLGDMYKTQVYELAGYLNTSGIVIPQTIIEKAPSAELYEGARDEDRLPPYEILDQILIHHIDEGWGLEELVLEGFDYNLCSEVLKLVSEAEFKRRQEPMAPEISGASFALRAWPVTNRFLDEG